MSPESERACTCCGQRLELRHPAVLDPETRERFRILGCPRCGSGRTFPVPLELGPYYAGSYYGARHGPTGWLCDRRRMSRLKRVVPRPGRLLDFGCGPGSFLAAAQRAGWTGIGVDVAPATARASGLDVRASLDQVGAEAAFDAITAWHSIEHLAQPAAVLEGLRDRLAAHGTLLVAVPDAGSLQARLFGPRWVHLDVPRHLHHLTRPGLARLLQASGLRPVRWWRHELEYDWMGWAQSALNAATLQPNTFMKRLTGKRRRSGLLAAASDWLPGLAALALAAPPCLLARAAGRGATLVVAARCA
ncbi:MAG: class I SAM-dependent methyltransferase [Myxococcota bacterium]